MSKNASPPISDITIHFNGNTFRIGEQALLTLIEVYKNEVPAKLNLSQGGLEFEMEKISRNGNRSTVKRDEFGEITLTYMLINGKLKPYEETK